LDQIDDNYEHSDESSSDDEEILAERVENLDEIVAERIEIIDVEQDRTEVEKEVDEFMSCFRVKTENNIDATLSKIEEGKKQIWEQNLLQENHITGYNQDPCKAFLKDTKHDDDMKLTEKLEEIIANAKEEFLTQQQRILDDLKDPPSRDYTICQELECPVCLTEMVPPTRIWQCSAGHAICQACKRNRNINKKCPTCRQAIIGRANTLEKMAASLFTKITGKEVPEVDDDNSENDDDEPQEEDEDTTATDVLHMLYLPMRHHAREFRNPVGSLEDEISRLINNISFLQGSRNSGLL